MQRMRDIVGLPVIETETGKQISQIEDIVLNIDEAKIYGIITNSAKDLSSEQGISFMNILSLGRDAVMVRNHSVIQEATAFFEVTAIYYIKELFEKEIVTEEGFRLGILVDVFFDTSTGEMKSYQISDSIITDLLYGRKKMPIPKIQVIGKDKVIVPGTMKTLLYTEI
ncbi:PRC-barrel domain-containing protein [Pelosinus sp. IPA-1]|uniref:PRC-barrel domain-containing protein n=1 Tax=Pelosinus sp. IPA-1 TaxID=3029569 RepID=UPI00243618F0|nr:PRC-barrel domain-containing protein [Pelosinus sp. IPA-1]GMA99160.1 photosystem reaction center subunit H [Pelosinus sp. IPA-1]